MAVGSCSRVDSGGFRGLKIHCFVCPGRLKRGPNSEDRNNNSPGIVVQDISSGYYK